MMQPEHPSSKPAKTLKVPASKMGEEEDLVVLIYKSSKRLLPGRRHAEADADKEKEQTNVASTGRRTSTRKRSSATQGNTATMDRPGMRSATKRRRQEPSEDNTKAGGKADWRKYAKICYADGCTNLAVKGGVCIKHGAKVKRCSSKGCTNQAQKGGLCIKLGQSSKSVEVTVFLERWSSVKKS